MNELLVDRLKTARTEKGFKQQDVAEQLGIKANTISNWEKGRTEPDIDTFVQLCDIYQIDCASLLSEVYTFNRIGTDISLFEYKHIQKYRDLDDHGRESVNITLDRESQRVTVLRDLQKQIPPPTDKPNKPNKLYLYTYLQKIACAGIGFYFADIPTDVIEAPYMHGADFIIGVNGDSMEPDFHDGERLYVQKVRELTLGDTGIFTIGNECFVKELGERGLISKNPEYEEILGTEDVRLIGRVLGKVEE